MRRLWTWYRTRRWWAKGLIAAPVLLVLAAGFYLLARFFQYRGSSATAGEFTPASAQVVARCVDGAGHWARFQKSEAGRAVLQKILKDPEVRRPLNALLAANDAPTLDNLDDKRWQERNGNLVNEATALRLAGRDVMAAVRLADRAEQTRFCVATKIGFWDFTLTPFAGLASGLIGAQKAQVGGTSCLNIRGNLVAFVGPIAVVSNDAALLTEALKRKGPKETPTKAIRVSVVFERSGLLNEAKRLARGFPIGLAAVIADPDPMSRLVVDADVQGGEFVVLATATGMRPGSAASAVTEPSKWTPAEGGGAVAINVSGEPFWRWMESASAGSGAAASQTQRYGLQLLQSAMRQLVTCKFPSDVLPKINGPLTVLYGTTTGTSPAVQGASIGVAALIFKSDDPAGAMAALSQMSREAIGQENSQVEWVQETDQGFALGYMVFRSDSFGYTDYKRPCVAVVNDSIVFANNLEFMRSVLATAAGQGGALVDGEVFKVGNRRLAGLGMKKIFADGMIASGFLVGGALRDGLSGYIPMWAETEVNTSESMRKLRQEIVAEFQREKRALNDSDITQAVDDRMDVRKDEAVKAMQGAVRPLDYVRYVAFEAERAGEDAVAVRVAVSVRAAR